MIFPSKPAAPDTLTANIEQSRDLITTSIALRARRRYPDDFKARQAYFNEECQRHIERFRKIEERQFGAGE
jgi:hypothetical protein